MDPAVAQLVAEAGNWELSGSGQAILQLGLLLEMHNRPGNRAIDEEYLPLSLRLVHVTHADQAEVVQALDRLIRDAPTEVARCSLLSALASALPSMAMAPALRFLMDPPERFAAGPTWERVLFVVDHLLDFTAVPADDPRVAAGLRRRQGARRAAGPARSCRPRRTPASSGRPSRGRLLDAEARGASVGAAAATRRPARRAGCGTRSAPARPTSTLP